jgi:hypothetical protein
MLQTILPDYLTDINFDKTTSSRLQFKFLPSFAEFLLKNKLFQLAILQLNLFKEFDPPVFRFFASRPETELILLEEQGLEKLLSALANNKASAFVEDSLNDKRFIRPCRKSNQRFYRRYRTDENKCAAQTKGFANP